MSDIAGLPVNIEQVQPDFHWKLASENYFIANGICVFKVRDHRIESWIDEQLSTVTADARQKGKKAGVSVEVHMPRIVSANTNAPGPLCSLEIVTTIKENPVYNLAKDKSGNYTGVGITAEAIAQQVLQTLHGWLAERSAQTWYPGNPPMAPNKEYDGGDLVAYDVKMAVSYPLDQLSKASPAPAISIRNGQVQITNTVSGATVYYTTDGSLPGVANPAAMKYVMPFNVPRGTPIRAASWLTDGCGSDIMSQFYP